MFACHYEPAFIRNNTKENCSVPLINVAEPLLSGWRKAKIHYVFYVMV